MKTFLNKCRLIIISVLLISIYGCRTVEKVKNLETFASKQDLKALDEKWTNSVQNIKIEVKEIINSKVKETLSIQNNTNSNKEYESSVIYGTIIPGEKEKIVSIGGTTIKSDGVNVTFEIKSTREKLEESVKKINELSKNIIEEKNARILLINEFNEYKKDQLNKIYNLEYKLNKKLKETSKSGFSFLIYFFIILCIFIVVIGYVYRKQIPFLKM